MRKFGKLVDGSWICQLTADEVAVVQKDGKVSFVANTARDRDEATCYYEIVR